MTFAIKSDSYESSSFVPFDVPFSDDFCGSTFGDIVVLQCVGWVYSSRKTSKDKLRVYSVKCNKCALDKELFGEAVFYTLKKRLKLGVFPCGCSKRVNWSESQTVTRLKRKCLETGYELVELSEPYCVNKAKVLVTLRCAEHGNFKNNANNIFNGQGCPECANLRRVEQLKDKNLKEQDYFIEKFKSSGHFHEDTRFETVFKETKTGIKRSWRYVCGKCGSIGLGLTHHLLLGSKSCLCTTQDLKQAYIKVLKSDGLPIAIKFGVSRNAASRVFRKCVYAVEHMGTYLFPDRFCCLAAERECIDVLDTGIVSRNEMPDGSTETMYLYNIDRVAGIYRKHGGIPAEEHS